MDENKDNLNKRINRRTTSAQFEKLVDLLETSTFLVSGHPSAQCGHPKVMSEVAWDNIAHSLNSIGPPQRTVYEWKKTWSDLRSRTRQNIAEMNKGDLYFAEGRSKPLNSLEFRVAKLCNLPTKPPPSYNNVLKSAPTNRVDRVFAPDFKSSLSSTTRLKHSPTLETISSLKPVQKTMKKKISKQKRVAYSKEVEVLRKQVAAQETTAVAMQSLVKSAEEQNKCLNQIAEACKLIASAMPAFIKHLK